MSKTKFPILLIGLFSGMLWGLNDVFTKVLSFHEQLPTLLTIIIFSLFLAFLQDSFSAFSILSYRKGMNVLDKSIKIKFEGWPWLLIAAIFAGPLGMAAGIIGIYFAGPVYAGSITACYPIITLLLAIIILKEKITWKRSLGILIAVIGIIAISIEGEHSHIKHLLWGIGFASIAMLGWGMESVLLTLAYRKNQGNMAALLAIRQSFSSLCYILLIITIIFFSPTLFLFFLHFFSHPGLLLACIFTAMGSYIAYYYFIKYVGSSLATLFNATFIFWAALFSWLGNISLVMSGFWLWASVLVLGLYIADSK